MSVEISLAPRKRESADGVVVTYMPLKNTSWMRFVAENRRMLMDVATSFDKKEEEEEEIDFNNLTEEKEEAAVNFTLTLNNFTVSLLVDHVKSVKGFFVNGKECADVETFVQYYPDGAFIMDLVSDILSSKLSPDEAKN